MKWYEMCFSPTGGTQKAVDAFAGELSEQMQFVDLTDADAAFEGLRLTADDVAILAVPSYGGRVPPTAAQRLARIGGNGARAILVCVYGNRAYEDTLTELRDIAEQAGFRVIAAVAAVAEHSIVRQIAQGRPDVQDCDRLREFAGRIWKKIEAGDTSEPTVPGNRPYKKSSGAGMVPKATKDCTGCGVCVEKCPVQAIDRADPRKVDEKACISCMRCVAICPHSARKVNGVMLAAAGMMLKKACSGRKECELYL